MNKTRFILLSLAGSTLLCASGENLLASWNEGKAKNNIIAYVNSATDAKSPDFIKEEDRIATFDNDGTLWSEQPMYTQITFLIDRIKELAPDHPEWKEKQPFKGVLEGDIDAIKKSGKEGLTELLAATHAGMSEDEFTQIVKKWLKKTKDPRFDRHYTELVFQPMLELLDYLRANGFKTFIVSGGGIDFMRPWTREVYGIPPYQIIGSSVKVKYENGVNMRLPELHHFDDGAGKPAGIHYHIGKHPVAAFGNSDGDFQMLEYTDNNKQYKSFQLYVHHTDAEREYAYDRKALFGKLDKGLDYANTHGWTVVDMKNDWKVIYPFELKK